MSNLFFDRCFQVIQANNLEIIERSIRAGDSFWKDLFPVGREKSPNDLRLGEETLMAHRFTDREFYYSNGRKYPVIYRVKRVS